MLDTNVLVAALRSSGGSSFRLLSLVGRSDRFEVHLSVPLVLEYEEAAMRQVGLLGLSGDDIADVLDYLCSAACLHEIFFLWRPMLRHPRDELVLEVAVAGSCQGIISHNKSDFVGAEKFGLWVESPREFLKRIGEQ
ncbi:MAG: PIN domain-containing protein [Candidatus Latescibacterota bacterium]